MNKHDYKLWRSRMRAINKQYRDSARAFEQAHRGSFNQNQDIYKPAYYNQHFTLYNDKVVNRSLKHGNFHDTTPYSVLSTERQGACLLYIRWTEYDWQYRRTTTGLSAAFCPNPTSTTWGGYSDGSAKRTAVQNLTQAALVNKVVSNAPNWDVMTDLAEGKETVGLLTSTASKFINIASMVKHRDVSGLLKFLKKKNSRFNRRKLRRELYQQTLGGKGVRVIDAMSNLWMNYRYGFMPMIYSMTDALIAFNASFAAGYRLTEQVTISDTIFSSKSEVGNGAGNGFKAKYDSTRSVQGSIRKKAYFDYTDAMWARLVGNPIYAVARSAWEVTPFSWVYDWFVGVGDYLNNLQVDTLVPSSSVNVTEKSLSVERMAISKGGALEGYSHTIESVIGVVGTSKTRYFARSIGNLSVPGVDLSQSWYTFKRSIDASCLAWQRVGKHLNTYVDPSGLRHRVH